MFCVHSALVIVLVTEAIYLSIYLIDGGSCYVGQSLAISVDPKKLNL